MTVQIYRQYVFTDGTKFTPNALDSEIDQVASTFNNANAGLITWDNIKVTTLTATTSTLTNATITTGTITNGTITNPTFTNPVPIAGGGTNSGTALNNNRVIVSSSGKIVETAALTSGQILVANGSGIPVSGVTGSMNSTKITSLANGSAAQDAVAVGQVANGTVNAAGFVIGTIVHTIQNTDATSTTSSGTTYTSTNLTATIVPKANTHQIKITVTGTLTDSVVVATTGAFASIFRGSTDLSNGNGFVSAGSATTTDTYPVHIVYIDSPATTSSTVYTVKIKSPGAAGDAIWNTNTGTCVIILEELAF